MIKLGQRVPVASLCRIMGKFALGIEVPENENSQASILGVFKIREFKLATSSEIACVDFLLGFLFEEQMTLQPRHCHLLPA